MLDYYVAVDENGQPYIAHAFWNKKGQQKQNHKYIARVERGQGRWRYFYTPKEWEAFNKSRVGIKQTAGKAADLLREISGAAAKKRITQDKKDLARALDNRNEAERRSRATQKRSVDSEVEALGTAAALRQLEEKADKSNIFTRSRNKKKADEVRARYNTVHQQYVNSSDAASRRQSDVERAGKLVSKYRDALAQDRDKYRHSLVGLLDRLGEITLDAVETLKTAGKKAATVIPGVEERRSAKEAEARVQKEMGEYRDSFRPDSGKDIYKEQREAEAAIDEALAAQKAYNKTALSKVEKFVKDPIGTVDDAVDDVKWTVEDAVNEAKAKKREKKNVKRSKSNQSSSG